MRSLTSWRRGLGGSQSPCRALAERRGRCRRVPVGGRPGGGLSPGGARTARARRRQARPRVRDVAADPGVVRGAAGGNADLRSFCISRAARSPTRRWSSTLRPRRLGIGTARFWHDLRPGDLHWTVTDTGWAKAAWGGLFGQMPERAAILNVDLGHPDPDTIFGILASHRVTSFCAPPTLYRRLVDGLLQVRPLGAAALHKCGGAAQPRGDPRVEERNGRSRNLRWLRPDRDDVHPIGLFPGYYEDPAATADAFRGPFYFTGDRPRRTSAVIFGCGRATKNHQRQDPPVRAA
jgi:hypothetical protein